MKISSNWSCAAPYESLCVERELKKVLELLPELPVFVEPDVRYPGAVARYIYFSEGRHGSSSYTGELGYYSDKAHLSEQELIEEAETMRQLILVGADAKY